MGRPTSGSQNLGIRNWRYGWKHRTLCFEPLEERRLLDAGGLTATRLSLQFAAASVAEGQSVACTVALDQPATSQVVISLSQSAADELDLPAVVIPAGQLSATVSISATDDTLIEKAKRVELSASADGYAAATAPIDVFDNDVPSLTIDLPFPARGGVEGGAFTATITRDIVSDHPLAISLRSSDAAQVNIPSSLVIPAGEASVNFEISTNEHASAGGSEVVTLTANGRYPECGCLIEPGATAIIEAGQAVRDNSSSGPRHAQPDLPHVSSGSQTFNSATIQSFSGAITAVAVDYTDNTGTTEYYLATPAESGTSHFGTRLEFLHAEPAELTTGDLMQVTGWRQDGAIWVDSMATATPEEVFGASTQTFSGSLNVIDGATDIYEFYDASGWKQLHFVDGASTTLRGGASAEVHGWQLGREIWIDSISPLNIATGDALINHKTLVAIANFTDATVSCSPSDLRNTLFDGPNSVNAFYESVTHGNTTFIGDVFDSVTISYSQTSSCDYFTWGNDALTQLQNRGVIISSYDHFIIVLPQSTCSLRGSGVIGGFESFNFGACSTGWIFAHELGHNLGFGHANTPGVDAGDHSSIMGYPQAMVNFNVVEAQINNWEPTSEQIEVKTNGIYQLAPFGTIGGPLKTVIKGKPPQGHSYLISYRTPIGFDANLEPSFQYKVTVHDVTGASQPTVLLAKLGDGQLYTGFTNDIFIKVLSHDSQSATISISFDAPPPENSGDYNGNGIVDAADYVLWRKTYGSPTDHRADGNGNGQVDQADYDYWRARFGNTVGSGAAASVTDAVSITAPQIEVGQALPDFQTIEIRSEPDPRPADDANAMSVREGLDFFLLAHPSPEVGSNKRQAQPDLRESIFRSQNALLAVLTESRPRRSASEELDIEPYRSTYDGDPGGDDLTLHAIEDTISTFVIDF